MGVRSRYGELRDKARQSLRFSCFSFIFSWRYSWSGSCFFISFFIAKICDRKIKQRSQRLVRPSCNVNIVDTHKQSYRRGKGDVQVEDFLRREKRKLLGLRVSLVRSHTNRSIIAQAIWKIERTSSRRDLRYTSLTLNQQRALENDEPISISRSAFSPSFSSLWKGPVGISVGSVNLVSSCSRLAIDFPERIVIVGV